MNSKRKMEANEKRANSGERGNLGETVTVFQACLLYFAHFSVFLTTKRTLEINQEARAPAQKKTIAYRNKSVFFSSFIINNHIFTILSLFNKSRER